MDKNHFFMQNLMVEEVPWHRLTTAYGRATEFPKHVKNLYDGADMKSVNTASTEITTSIKHQSTFWHSTPFAMIFLTQIFAEAVSDIKKSGLAYFISEQLLNFFGEVAECISDVRQSPSPDPFPFFSDMFKKDYL